jgi:hypothetical protein
MCQSHLTISIPPILLTFSVMHACQLMHTLDCHTLSWIGRGVHLLKSHKLSGTMLNDTPRLSRRWTACRRGAAALPATWRW